MGSSAYRLYDAISVSGAESLPWTKLGGDNFKCIITHLGTKNAAKLFTGGLLQSHQLVCSAALFPSQGTSLALESRVGADRGRCFFVACVVQVAPIFSFCCA